VAQSSLSKLPAAAKVGIAVGLLAVVGVAYFVVFYGDVASRISAAKANEQKLRTELDDARRAELSYQKDLAELSEREQRQRDLNKVLPASAEYPGFLSSVQAVANVSGVNLKAWSPQEEVVEQFYARVPMKLEFTGKYHQVAKFFFGVGQLDRIINMENISLNQPTTAGEDVVVKVESMATAFRALPDVAVGPGGDRRGAAQGAQP
jgi:type IV pilus assembly protein PilO